MVSPHLLVTLSINDIDHELALEPRRTLLDALRHDLQLTGTKKVCDMGNCGDTQHLSEGNGSQSVGLCLGQRSGGGTHGWQPDRRRAPRPRWRRADPLAKHGGRTSAARCRCE